MSSPIDLKLEKKQAYQIVIKPNLITEIDEQLKRLNLKTNRIFIITHPSLNQLYGNKLRQRLESSGYSCDVLEVPEGEKSKSMTVVEKLLLMLLQKQVERNDMVLSLGGGVIGDLAGFVASITLRGIQFVQVPTSLLAQVDASIGGKTGVNHKIGKNLIGSFYQPLKVCIDPLVLQSLDQRQLRSGFAEVIKYAVIWDKEFFDYIEKNMHIWTSFNISKHKDQWLYIIKRSCEIKAQVVSEDETEKGVRAILNYGHTIGHAIEAEFKFNGYLHGEAIALGICVANIIAQKIGGLDMNDAQRIKKMLKDIGFNLILRPCKIDNLLQYLRSDKKRLDSKHRFILPTKIGQVKIQTLNDEQLIYDSIEKIME